VTLEHGDVVRGVTVEIGIVLVADDTDDTWLTDTEVIEVIVNDVVELDAVMVGVVEVPGFPLPPL
jgi:hypothetical protein